MIEPKDHTIDGFSMLEDVAGGIGVDIVVQPGVYWPSFQHQYDQISLIDKGQNACILRVTVANGEVQDNRERNRLMQDRVLRYVIARGLLGLIADKQERTNRV